MKRLLLGAGTALVLVSSHCPAQAWCTLAEGVEAYEKCMDDERQQEIIDQLAAVREDQQRILRELEELKRLVSEAGSR